MGQKGSNLTDASRPQFLTCSLQFIQSACMVLTHLKLSLIGMCDHKFE